MCDSYLKLVITIILTLHVINHCSYNIIQCSQAKLPEQFELDVIRKKFGDVITPTTVVLLQELERFNKLIKRMDISLNNLQKVGTWKLYRQPLKPQVY